MYLGCTYVISGKRLLIDTYEEYYNLYCEKSADGTYHVEHVALQERVSGGHHGFRLSQLQCRCAGGILGWCRRCRWRWRSAARHGHGSFGQVRRFHAQQLSHQLVVLRWVVV